MAGRAGFDASIRGVEELEKLGRDLRAAGAKDLKKELMRSGRALKEPFKAALVAHALSDLPKRGGLNQWVAGKIKVTSSVRLSGKLLGVRMKSRHPGKDGLSDLPAINTGRVRHPLFGDTDRWYLTQIPAGFVQKALDDMGDTIREEFLRAVDDVAARLRAGG
jgi:hypothetical protein